MAVLDKYLSIKDLAAEIGVNRRTLNRWNELRMGPPVTRIGHRVYYNKDSVDAWLRSREHVMVREKTRAA